VPARPKRTERASVIRLADANGSSRSSWQAAVADAVRSVRDEVTEPIGVEVTRMWADLDGTKVRTYRVAVKVAHRQALKAPARRARA
jgi:flavin-binding protein dodecin